MNYGKQNVTKRKKHIASKKNMKKKRVGVRFFKALIICVLVLAIIGIGGAGFFAKRIIDNAPAVTPADIKPKGFTSFVYAEDGTLLESFVEAGSNRVYKSLDEIPEHLGEAFVAIEDERFYQHNGIDLQGILRAGIKGLASGSFDEGASTLTQQLIKNNVFINFVDEVTFYDRLERKLQEQYLALEIEKQMSKEEILENYMNTINLGQSCLGVQAASKRYFGKNVSDLTLSECAVIAGITQNPTKYDPVVNPTDNADRRNIVLKNMLDQKYITKEEYDTAKADPVYDRIIASPPVEDTTPYSYFNDRLSQQIVRDLMERKNFTETQAYNALYSGGLTIVSTQDPRVQQICDEEVANEEVYPAGTEYGLEFALTITRADGTVENYSKEMLGEYIRNAWGFEYPLIYSSPDEANAAVAEYKSTLGITENDTVDERIDITPQPQVSFVLMDQATGKVKAIVGGRGQKTASLSLNRATDSPRQPGSCFKILSTYAPALDSCGYTLASALKNDKPYDYGNGKTGNNYDNSYPGTSTMRYSIEHSINVAALNTLTAIGFQTGFDYLKNFGFTTIVDSEEINGKIYTDKAAATALGGITKGVYNLEMTAAYASIANNGTYIEPILYTQVLDHDGNILLDNTTPVTRQVLKDSTAALLTNAMQDVITKGTGVYARMNNMPVSGKTGTTEYTTDLWLSAYTPYYTASIWVGYDESKPMEHIWDQKWHMVLWKNIMERVHEGLEYKEFTMPSSVSQKTVCSITGLLATESCPGITEYFAEGTIPTQTCAGHAVEKDPDDNDKDKDKDKDKTNNNNDTDDDDSSDTDSNDNNSGGSTDGNTDSGTTTPNNGGTTTPDNGNNRPTP